MLTERRFRLSQVMLLALALHACRQNPELYPGRKITFHVIPKSMPDTVAVYITGNNPLLGNWNPQRIPLTRQSDGGWRKTFIFPAGLHVEYKITRGSWNKEAIDTGGFIPGNFIFDVKNDTTIVNEIAHWRDVPYQHNNEALKKITFHVVPQSMPDTASIYIAGNHMFLGSWSTDAVPLRKQADGSWRRTIAFPAGIRLQYKFTRGSWLKEAVAGNGRVTGAFRLDVKIDTTVNIAIANWRDVVYGHREKINEQRRADQCFDQGQRFRRAMQYDSSNFYFEKAARLYAEIPEWRRYVLCCLRMGENFDNQAEYDRAMACCKRALEIALHKFDESHPDINLVDNHTARLYNNIGVLHRKKGDYDKAIEYCHKALAVWSQARGESRMADDFTGYSLDCSYSELGDIYRLQGDYDQAIAYYNKVSEIISKDFGEPHPNVARNYNFIGGIYADKGDHEQAMQYHQKALAIKRHFYNGNHIEVAASYQQLGKAYLDNGDHEQALTCVNKALKVWREVYDQNHPLIAEAYLIFGKSCYQRKDFEKALHYAQRALIALVADFHDTSFYANPPLRGVLYENELLNALAFKAEVLEKLPAKTRGRNNLQTALATYQAASELIDQMRSGYKAEGSKLFLAGRMSQIYERAIQTALQLHAATRDPKFQMMAFHFAEKSKAGVLAQALQESAAKKFAGIPAPLLEKEKELRRNLAFLDTEVQKESQKKDGGDHEKIQRLEDQLFALKTEFEALSGNFEAAYPSYFDIKYRIQTVSPAELQDALDEHTTVLEYFVGERAIYIFSISKRAFEVVGLPKPAGFASLVNAYFTSLKRPLDEKEFRKCSTQLYALLIQPLAAQLAWSKKIVVIPDGLLHYVPFEALLVQENGRGQERPANEHLLQPEYLLSKFDFSYHYSAALYLNCRKQGARNYAVENFVGFAPVFKPERGAGYSLASHAPSPPKLPATGGVRLVTREGLRLEELKYSETEVQTIAKLFGGSKSRGYFHQQASEENFKSQIADCKYVHVSTHGFMNEERPQLSGLAFFQPPSAAEDGILYAGESYNLNLNADLVVLSSCESGMGKLVKGEGLMALTRGFLYSGANNVLVSLWKVFDEHTSELMIEFYKQMLAGKSYSAALRAAKLKMLQNPNTASPTSWASFVLIGE